jgi:hypothetical protein
MTEDALIRAAARNNAEWCAAMSRAHGVPSRFGEQAWTAPTRTPIFYPDAVTLIADADAVAVVAAIDAGADASIKDSFADLDLTWAGFEVLFDAHWLYRPADAPVSGCDLDWERVTDAGALRAWSAGWDGGGGHEELFRPALLDDPATSVLAGLRSDGSLAGGAVATRSDEVVGISNLFAVDGDAVGMWPLVLGAVRALCPELPVVTYDHGDEVIGALRHGFRRLGPLRVWRHP